MEQLNNKTALITGGNTGIGYGIAQVLLQQGMNVVITSRSLERATKAQNQLNDSAKGRVLGLACDTRIHEQLEAVVSQTIEKFGTLDCVVANAGVGHFASIVDMTLTQWNEVIDTNLTGVFHTVKASIPALTASKGYIFTISSLAGANFFEKASAYNASKFGLTGFTQAIMLDLRKMGIKVTTIMPGSVASNFNGHTPSEHDAWKIQPEDIGIIIRDLLLMHPRTLPSKVEVRPSIPG